MTTQNDRSLSRKTALSTAAAITLTIAGGVSALFLTIGTGADAQSTTTPTIVTEYVDAAGNPVVSPGLMTSAATSLAVVPQEPGAAEYDDEEHEDEEHEDEEYDDEEHDDD